MTATPDHAIQALAARQDGVVFHEQCLRLGLSSDQIAWRVRSRRWQGLHRGVYAVGAAPLVPRARYLAAVFASGPGAKLSHRSGASHWEVQPHHPGDVHVVAAISRRSRDGIAVHRTRRLLPHEVTVRGGVPVTSLARTLIDLAEVGSALEVETAVRAAERIHRFDRALLEPIRGRSSNRRLHPPDRFTRGSLEPLLVRMLERHHLPLPEMNVRWQGLELDAVWWDAGVVLEVDDWETHRDRDAFIRDRRRARRLQAAGFRSVQATYEDLTVDAAAFAAELRHLGVGAL